MKTKDRIKKNGEIFTPSFLVNDILNKLEETDPTMFSSPEKTFCDPASGNGNMLIEVLKRKLSKGHDPTQAISTIYGSEIMYDNVVECRKRILKIIHEAGTIITLEHINIVFTNIFWADTRKYPKGSLDYDFSFLPSTEIKEMNRWLIEIQKDPEFLTKKETMMNIPEEKDMFSINLMENK